MNSIKKLITTVLLLLAFVACGQQNRKQEIKKAVLDVTLSSMGKCPPAYRNKIPIANRRYVTSALFVYMNNSDTLTPLPINDKVFNYDYFNREIYPKMDQRKAKVKVEKYQIGSKEVFLVYAIE